MYIKELVNAFNLNNYASDKINTNFTMEGKKIVGLFVSNTNTKEYLRGVGEEIIKRHYSGGSEVARKYYNLNYFPFVNSGKEKDIDENVKKVELTDSTNNEVIRNLKVHFANEFKRAVEAKVVARLQEEVEISEEEAYEWVNRTVGTGAIGMPYLYCIAFSGEYLKRRYGSETFELLKEEYIKEFNSRLKNCGLKSSDFYEYKNDMLYIKNIGDKVVRSVAEYVRERVALDFSTPGTEDSKVENFKDVLGNFIFEQIRKSINAYDIFTGEKKIQNGESFVLIPLTERYSGQLEFLKRKDVYKINIKYKNLMSDIRGKTEDPDINSCEDPIYAFSNKGIAQLIPEIMESAITYNKENKRFEFAVDPGNFRRRDSIRGSQSSSTVTSPTRTNSAGSSQLQSPLDSPTPPEPPRTPPEHTGRRSVESRGDSDSGLGDSPPQPKDSVAHSPSGVPRSLFEQPQAQRFPMRSRGGGLESPPRQWSEREEETGRMFQLVLGEIDPSQPTCVQSQLSLTCRPLSIPFPIAWDNSISLNLGVSEDSPKDTENICNEEHKEQKVIGKSDQKSSDECSEAKSQESESPEKKHGGGWFCKERKKLSHLKRRSVERDTISSSKSDLVYHVTEKSSVSKPFRSFPTRIKAESNPPSGVTSPTHEGGPEWQQRLNPDQREGYAHFFLLR